MSSTEPTHNLPEYSVSEISGALKKAVESQFSYVRVRGEISGFKRAASGHLYFNLKDENAVLNAVCWKGVSSRFNFQPEDGLEVLATGKISTYPGRSNYQIVIEAMEPAGIGALLAQLEKRKKQLAEEGLFSAERKQPIPQLPKVIGVVTSPTGAVIRDILHRISERFPVHVLVWPVAVQGDGAAEQIAAAIEGFNNLPDSVPTPETLIVARGGGSLEDLWAFNEEVVVRAAAASTIPLISAVGHETDTTLIDFVSDRRAPTPTAAAEMAVPVRDEMLAWLMDTSNRLFHLINGQLEQKHQHIQSLSRALISPRQMIETQTQRLDDWSERLVSALKQAILEPQHKLARLTDRLQPSLILSRIEQAEQKITSYDKLLESYHYKKVLQRGYAIVHEGDAVITSAKSVSVNASLNIEFADGKVAATVDGSRKPKATKKSNDSQESLF